MAIVAPKGRKHLSADALFRLVHTGFDSIPEYRPADADISLTDARMSAFAMFSLTLRMVKIFELAFLLEGTLLPSPALRLVFRSTLTHTQRPYPYSASIWMAKAEGGGHGLETPAGVHHGNRRSGTAVTQ